MADERSGLQRNEEASEECLVRVDAVAGWGMRSGVLMNLGWVWMTMRRAVHVPAAGLWPRTLIIIYSWAGPAGPGGLKLWVSILAFLPNKFYCVLF